MTQKGGILSEYMPQTKPFGKVVPATEPVNQRAFRCGSCNRSKGAEWFIDYGRLCLRAGKNIYALPGRVGDVLSGGCNRLIRQGAGIIVSSPEEWFKDLEIDLANIVVSNAFSKKVLEKR